MTQYKFKNIKNWFHKKAIFYWFCTFAIIIFLLSDSIHLFKRDILFHEDIARDFLVMDEIVATRKPTLLGPKSGAIPGVFHGPLWYYINLPFFVISKGSPLGMGIFWYALFLGAISLFYGLSKKMAGKQVALIAVVLLLGLSTFMPMALWQESLAFFLSFLFFYLLYHYLKTSKPVFLLASWFVLGCIIQAQMAFGVPLLLLSVLYTSYFILKNKQYLHLTSLLVLSVPLSSFIFFDLRHDFLQTKAVLAYFRNNSLAGFSWFNYFVERLTAMIDLFKLVKSHFWVNAATAVIGLMSLVKLHQLLKTSQHLKTAWHLSLWLVIGYFVVTLPFRSQIHWYYYEPFLPLFCFWWAYYVQKAHQRAVYFIFGVIVLINLAVVLISDWHYLQTGQTYDEESHLSFVRTIWWHSHFYEQLANDVFADGENNFGYFVFEMDQYGFQAKHMMIYMGNKLNKSAFLCQKRPVVYLIIGKNDHTNPLIDEKYWQTHTVGIEGEPVKIWSYPDGHQVWKFNLTPEQITIPVDPNLLCGAYFR